MALRLLFRAAKKQGVLEHACLAQSLWTCFFVRAASEINPQKRNFLEENFDVGVCL